MITDTLEGRVKLAFAYGKTDEEIAQQEDIPVEMVADILKDSRLPIKIKSITVVQVSPRIITE